LRFIVASVLSCSFAKSLSVVVVVRNSNVDNGISIYRECNMYMQQHVRCSNSGCNRYSDM